jgi:hypothetical protein
VGDGIYQWFFQVRGVRFADSEMERTEDSSAHCVLYASKLLSNVITLRPTTEFVFISFMRTCTCTYEEDRLLNKYRTERGARQWK